jgi:hypothetical protein
MADKECIYLTSDGGTHKVGDRIILTGKVIEVFRNRNSEQVILIEIKKDNSLAFHQ